MEKLINCLILVLFTMTASVMFLMVIFMAKIILFS